MDQTPERKARIVSWLSYPEHESRAEKAIEANINSGYEIVSSGSSSRGDVVYSWVVMITPSPDKQGE